MRRIGEYAVVYIIGGVGYTIVEILWRGYSHWTMALTGGMCFMFIYMNEAFHNRAPLWKRCLVGSLIISLSELTVGFVVNILLGWHVWDYSNRFLNLFGQVCALYSSLWFLLCIPVAGLCTHLRKWLRGVEGKAKVQRSPMFRS
ncbi:MAG: hypothetical protein IJ428_03200 [Clostridia bacterium]|nr:hypothetical protein [Clostridia bacterium]